MCGSRWQIGLLSSSRISHLRSWQCAAQLHSPTALLTPPILAPIGVYLLHAALGVGHGDLLLAVGAHVVDLLAVGDQQRRQAEGPRYEQAHHDGSYLAGVACRHSWGMHRFSAIRSALRAETSAQRRTVPSDATRGLEIAITVYVHGKRTDSHAMPMHSSTMGTGHFATIHLLGAAQRMRDGTRRIWRARLSSRPAPASANHSLRTGSHYSLTRRSTSVRTCWWQWGHSVWYRSRSLVTTMTLCAWVPWWL